jgi:hypothetical protein
MKKGEMSSSKYNKTAYVGKGLIKSQGSESNLLFNLIIYFARVATFCEDDMLAFFSNIIRLIIWSPFCSSGW